MGKTIWESVIRYRVYDIEHGLLIEPTFSPGGDRIFSDYDTVKEATDVIKERVYSESVILPIVYVRPKFDEIGGQS